MIPQQPTAAELAQINQSLIQEHLNLAVMVMKGMTQLFAQAQMGDPGARMLAAGWLEALDAARAAAKGITLARTVPKH
jgi:hypothetical protein